MSKLEEITAASSEQTKGFLKKQATVTPTVEETKAKPTFIQVEEPNIKVDTLKIYSPNPSYEYHWCNEVNVSNGRSGMWVVVDKNHPDFKNLRVQIDHAIDKSFFKFKDLILCCARKETAVKRRQMHSDIIRNRSKSVDRKFGENVKKIQKSLGDRSEAIRTMEKLEEEENG
jgi:hypothetical protein